MKIRYKLTLVFTGLMAAIILLLSIFIYVFSVQNVRQSFFKRLEKAPPSSAMPPSKKMSGAPLFTMK